jgi:hypothetical protein
MSYSAGKSTPLHRAALTLPYGNNKCCRPSQPKDHEGIQQLCSWHMISYGRPAKAHQRETAPYSRRSPSSTTYFPCKMLLWNSWDPDPTKDTC